MQDILIEIAKWGGPTAVVGYLVWKSDAFNASLKMFSRELEITYKKDKKSNND
jgi:hypothetical protein